MIIEYKHHLQSIICEYFWIKMMMQATSTFSFFLLNAYQYLTIFHKGLGRCIFFLCHGVQVLFFYVGRHEVHHKLLGECRPIKTQLEASNFIWKLLFPPSYFSKNM